MANVIIHFHISQLTSQRIIHFHRYFTAFAKLNWICYLNTIFGFEFANVANEKRNVILLHRLADRCKQKKKDVNCKIKKNNYKSLYPRDWKIGNTSSNVDLLQFDLMALSILVGVLRKSSMSAHG